MSKKLYLAVLSFFLFAAAFFPASAKAATYYIEWRAGSDTNNGTSKTSPWKRQPYMNGFTGTYVHSAGDQFIFKGGVTWPFAAFPMTIAAGGAAGNNDYYGVDKTWFTAGSWTQPVFDFNFQTTGGTWGQPIALTFPWITFDNLEVKNFFIDTAFSINANCMFYSPPGQGNVLLTNMLIHDWTTNAVATDGQYGAVCALSSSNLTIDHTTIYNSQGAKNYGVCSFNWDIVRFSTLHDCTQGVFAGVDVHDNTIYNIPKSFDPTAHENALQVNNNIIHDVGHGTALYLAISNLNGTYNIYNNVIYNSVVPFITVDPDTLSSAPVTVNVWNNTCANIVAESSQICVRNANRGGSALITTLQVQNNFSINNAAPSKAFSFDQSVIVNPIVQTNNVITSESNGAAQGFVPANLFSPTVPSAGTVNKGINLSSDFTTDITGALRPRVGAWDVGARQFATTITKLNPATNLSVVVH
jgi:hypothetical protein